MPPLKRWRQEERLNWGRRAVFAQIAGETRSHARVACEGPRATMKKRTAYRRARACPSPGRRAREGSRGTGPRATVGEAGMLISVVQERLLLRRSGAGAPELQFPLGPLGPKCL